MEQTNEVEVKKEYECPEGYRYYRFHAGTPLGVLFKAYEGRDRFDGNGRGLLIPIIKDYYFSFEHTPENIHGVIVDEAFETCDDPSEDELLCVAEDIIQQLLHIIGFALAAEEETDEYVSLLRRWDITPEQTLELEAANVASFCGDDTTDLEPKTKKRKRS